MKSKQSVTVMTLPSQTLVKVGAFGRERSASNRRVKHLLSLGDLKSEELIQLIERSAEFAADESAGGKPLAGKIVGIYFRKPSTRTRSSFAVGALRLGAETVAYGPTDLQIVTGETICDTARVLSGYLDCLVIRTNESMVEMRALANQDEMAVINAMSEDEHPTQAIADLSTIREHFGRLEGLEVLYIGEGNNTAAALALAIARIPDMRITFLTPEGYGVPERVLENARKVSPDGGEIEQRHDPDGFAGSANVVYTSRWQTMGVPHQDPDWRKKFWPYRVTPALMKRVSRRSGTIFLHDLPAVRGEDVSDEVLDGAQSLAWRQARHKMFSAMAVLERSLGSGS